MREGLWHTCMLSAQPCSSSGSFSPEVLAAFLSSVSHLHSPHLRTHKIARLYCHPPPGPVYAVCSQLLGEETWWDLVCAGWACVPLFCPFHLGRAPLSNTNYLLGCLEVDALKEWWCCWHALLGVILGCPCPLLLTLWLSSSLMSLQFFADF